MGYRILDNLGGARDVGINDFEEWAIGDVGVAGLLEESG